MDGQISHGQIFYRQKKITTSVRDALSIARKIRLQSKIESEKIINKAKKSSQAIQQKLLEDCFNEFRKKAQIDNLLESQKLRQKLLNKNRQTILDMACHLAKELIETELQTNPNCLLPRVHRAITNINTQEQAILEISAESFDSVQQEISELIEVRVNSKLTKFDFLLITSSGTVEGILDHQLETIKQKLKENAENIFEIEKNEVESNVA